MTSKLGAALFLLPMIAAAALAQSEYGRAGGDEVSVLFKQSNPISGSFGITMGGSDASKGFTGAVGGALVADRLWFFAAGQREQNRQFVSTLPQLPAPAALADGKLVANIGSRQVLTAAAGAANGVAAGTAPVTLPSSFLSLHYTGIISSSSFFTAKIDTRRTTGEPAFFTHW